MKDQRYGGRLSVLLVATVALIASCAGQGTQAASSPSTTVTPTVTAAALTCRMPISNSVPGTSGFITFPGGAFTVDPTSNPRLPGYSDNSYVNGYTYDFKWSRWLPVSYRAVSTDGSMYAYFSTAMHVVSLDSGADRSLGAPSGWSAGMMEPPDILALTPDGVYAHAGLPGLWLIGTAGTAQVTTEGYWDAVSGGAAWGRSTNIYPAEGSVYSILRLDLKTGVAQPWFTKAGVQQVVGADVYGNPVVMVTPKTGTGDSDLELWVVTGRDQGARIFSANSVVHRQLVLGLVTPAIGDSHGIWFQAGPSLYLYSEHSGVQKMADGRAGLAGGCG
jgi:hypothetical protein